MKVPFYLPSVSKLKPRIIFTQINLKQKALADSMFPAGLGVEGFYRAVPCVLASTALTHY